MSWKTLKTQLAEFGECSKVFWRNYPGRINQVKTREKGISYRGNRICKKPKYGTVRHPPYLIFMWSWVNNSLSLSIILGVTISKFSNCWFKLLFLGLLYIYFLKTRRLKSISNNLNDMTKLITTPCFLVNTVRIPIILKLIVLLADTYIQAFPHLSCCLCLHLQMGRQGAWFHSKLCFLAHTAQTNGNNI